MKPIHPICVETCREHYGKPVLVILKDGGEIAGILTKLENGQIILNGETAAITNKKSARKPGTANKKNGGKAKVSFSPFTPYPFAPVPYPYGAAIALDLALIALLFAFF